MKRPFYRRWYGIAGILLFVLLGLVSVAAVVVIGPLGRVVGVPYRAFYIPSEAMSPTLLKNDRILAHMRRPSELRRGMIILLAVGEHVYIKRIAALPGDRLELIEGEVFLNGRSVPRRLIGVEPYDDPGTFGPAISHARRFREQFPGESGTHEIYDLGPSQGDNFPRLVVPPGHVFVLGDNRDQSADSRFPREQMGVSILPIADIQGVALSLFSRPGEGFLNIPLNAD